MNIISSISCSRWFLNTVSVSAMRVQKSQEISFINCGRCATTVNTNGVIMKLIRNNNVLLAQVK